VGRLSIFGGRFSGWDCLRRFGGLDLLDFQPTAPVNVLAKAEAQEGVERGFDHVGSVLGPERFAQDIFDTGGFEDRADGFAGDNAGAGGSRTQQDSSAAVMGKHFMRNGGVFEADSHHLRAGEFAAFANRVSDFPGFAQADPNPAALIADDNQSAEIEAPAAFDDLGRAVNKDHFLSQLLFLAFPTVAGVRSGTTAAGPEAVAASRGSCFGLLDRFYFIAVVWWGRFRHNFSFHGTLEFQPGFPGCIRKRFYLAVVAG
jgi:hypothetical protein